MLSGLLSKFTSLHALTNAVGLLLTVLTFTHNLPFVPANMETLVGSAIAVLTWVSVHILHTKAVKAAAGK